MTATDDASSTEATQLERLQGEHAAARAQRDLALRAGEMGVFAWDIVSGELEWDDRLLELFGYGPDEAFGGTKEAAFSKVHPDDLPAVTAAMDASLDSSGPFRVRLRVQVRPDVQRWVQVQGRTEAGPDGAPARMLGVTWDITDAQNARGRAERLLDAMPMGFVILTDWRYSMVNEMGARLSGLPAPQLLGRLLWEQFPQLVTSPLGDMLRRVAATGQPERLEAFYPAPLDAWFDVSGVRLDDGSLAVSYQDVDIRRREELALRANAEHERVVADTLQRALLTAPADVAGLVVAARYVPAADDLRVGGDWWDAIAQPDGSTTVVIGDVVGHDIRAAAAMGQLRRMLRALAWGSDATPAQLVSRLDRTMGGLQLDTMASLLCAHLGLPAADGSRSLTWTNAGHLAPLLQRPDGSTEWLDDAPENVWVGLPAFARPGSERVDHRRRMTAGSRLVLFTDGLVERPGEHLDAGLERLSASMSRVLDRTPDEIGDALVADLVAGDNVDDVAVLVVLNEGRT